MSKKQFEDRISAALGRKVTAENVYEGGRDIMEIRVDGLHFRVMNGGIVARRSGSRNWIIGVT